MSKEPDEEFDEEFDEDLGDPEEEPGVLVVLFWLWVICSPVAGLLMWSSGNFTSNGIFAAYLMSFFITALLVYWLGKAIMAWL